MRSTNAIESSFHEVFYVKLSSDVYVIFTNGIRYVVLSGVAVMVSYGENQTFS